MSKSNDQTLILPGETGWETWTRHADGEFVRQHVSEHSQAGEVEDLPAGDLTMLFAAKAVTAVPMRVMTNDGSLLEDLVMLHAERLALRPDPLAGQLTDIFIVDREDESTVLLAAFLKPPAEGELPVSSPKAFDLSARSFRVEGNAVCLWRELGRWVFGVFYQGKLLFCQATAVDSVPPNPALAREVKLSMMQLSMQGLDVKPSRMDVWLESGACDVSALEAAFDLPVRVSARPAPLLSEPMSKLLPEDVREARFEARRRQSIRLGVAAVLLFYLGLVGWLGFGLWKDAANAKALHQLAREAAPEGDAYALHMAKWNELADAIDLDHSPVDLLYRIAGCIPAQGGLRLETADISASSITLRGEAPQLQAVNRFSLNLTKHNGLSRFEWETPEPNQSTAGWKFGYRGSVPHNDTTP